MGWIRQRRGKGETSAKTVGCGGILRRRWGFLIGEIGENSYGA